MISFKTLALVLPALVAGAALGWAARTAPAPAEAAPTAAQACQAPVGGGVAVADRADRLTVRVHGFTDPATSTNRFNQPTGRFVLVDWSVTNEGSAPVDVSPTRLKLRTADARVYSYANSAGLSEPHFGSFSLAPGETVRGYLAYDLPADAAVEAALYQPLLGGGSTVIATP